VIKLITIYTIIGCNPGIQGKYFSSFYFQEASLQVLFILRIMPAGRKLTIKKFNEAPSVITTAIPRKNVSRYEWNPVE